VGTVRIDIAPGQSFVAPVVVWSDTGILVKVPDVSGIPTSYRGQLSVVPAGSVAVSTAFEFVPAKETRILVPDLTQGRIDIPGGLGVNIEQASSVVFLQCFWR
jgi:hypothetical protein